MNIAKKEKEWNGCRKKVKILRNKISSLSHTYRNTEEIHDPDCKLCSMQKQLANRSNYSGKAKELRRKVSNLDHEFVVRMLKEKVHEPDDCECCRMESEIKSTKLNTYVCLLPDRPYEQHAVAFELIIPDRVACLRDSLYIFSKWATDMCGERLSIRGNWMQILRRNSQNLSGNSIHLGCTTVGILYTRLHVDESFERFVVNNGFNCVFHSSNVGMIPKMADDSLKSKCSFSVEEDSKYMCLKWTVSGTSHTQNEVLARQSECVQGLSVNEFKNFGSLRADGHRLQWRKLYAMIETDALSFENASVLSLIMQTIWQTGISGDIGSVRESHEDLKSIKFLHEMISLLSRYIEHQKYNWSYPLVLLMVALISVRVFELNEDADLAERIATFLDKLRTVAVDWMQKYQNAIQDVQSHDQFNENTLRSKLIYVAIAGAVTFYVHPRHKFFNEIFLPNQTSGFTSHRMWLIFIVTLNNSIILKQQQPQQQQLQQQQTEPNLQMLLQMVQSIGIHIESTLLIDIKHSPKDIHNFINKIWTRCGRLIKTRSHIDCRNILVIDVKKKYALKRVTIDLISGSFLVNNMPVCRLPNGITQSELFKNVFEHFIFEVQPDATKSFTTIHEYNGNRYEFMQTDSQNRTYQQN